MIYSFRNSTSKKKKYHHIPSYMQEGQTHVETDAETSLSYVALYYRLQKYKKI